MSDTSSIILTGEILPGRNIRDVVPALAQLLKTTEEKAIKCLAGRETVIKHNVPRANVDRYLNALAKVGVGARHEPSLPRVEIAPEQPSAPTHRSNQQPAAQVTPPPAPAIPDLIPMTPASETVICPQCGHQQPKRTLCLQCGCDMPRMRAAKEQMATEARSGPSVYQAPRAMVMDQESDEAEFTPPCFGLSMEGRIGRLRYIAYGWAVVLAVMIVGILAAIAIPAGFKIAFLPLVAVGIVAVWLGLRTTVLRLHDVNLSGKWILFFVLLGAISGAIRSPAIMGISTVLMWLGTLALVVWPGRAEANDYGPPSGPNTTLIKVGAILLIVVQVIGMLSLLKSGDYREQLTASMGAGGRETALDFSNPVYAEVRIKQAVGGRELEMMYLGKMANESDCQKHAAALSASFISGCRECTASPPLCKRTISARDEMIFDNEPIHATYISMAAGDASEREGRIIFWGLTVAEGNQVCDAMRGKLQSMHSGTVSCVRASGG